MKFISRMLAILFFASTAFSGPILVGRGAGQSEFSILFARTNLKNLVTTCLKFDCGLTHYDQQIIKLLIPLSENPYEVIFKDENTLIGRPFRIDRGESQVWINKDLLWNDSAKTQAYLVPDAVNLWIDILSESSNFSKAALARIKAATYEFLNKKFMTFSETINAKNILGATVWQQDQQDQIYLYDSSGAIVDVNYKIGEALGCGTANDLHLNIFSGTWQKLTNEKYFLKASIGWGCGRIVQRSELFISVKVFMNQDALLQIDPASLIIILGDK